jgi:alpha-mannosidase
MPDFTPYTQGQLAGVLQRLQEAAYTHVADLEVHAWRTREPVPYADRMQGEERSLRPGDVWGELFDCAWFRFRGTVPQDVRDRSVVLLLDVHGEMCVVDDEGAPLRGLTTVASVFDLSLGKPGKRVLRCAVPEDGVLEVWADAGCNDLFGHLPGNGTLKEASIALCHEDVRALAFDVEVLFDALDVLPDDSPRFHQIRRALTQVAHLLNGPAARQDGVAAIAAEARAILAAQLQMRGGDPSLRISAVGHAHMDLAWLWPIRETIRKGARTFATALDLFDRYPDYIFGASQPQYFAWMKEHYPPLWQRIVEAVRDGRIETQGCMWVEADTNVSGGEALVRQILLGRHFWQQEFGTDATYLWLPDVFGYSGALPQILRKAGVDVFATQKLSWSLINKFPHHSFRWRGIDGTEVLSHMFPEDTYNGPALPRSVRRIERNYRDKDVSTHALMVYGIGDGGGGPGAEHLERLSRIRDLAGFSPVQPGTAADFFRRWKQEAGAFPVWSGELYLERHQGTLTTQAANKRYNRKLELALRDLEFVALLASREADVDYPAGRLDAIWKEVLLYQFHDILPGSSIKRVYDESVPRYAALLAEVEALRDDRLAALAATVDGSGVAQPVLVVNSLSWERREWLDLGEGRWQQVTVPPMGWVVVDAAGTLPAAGLTARDDLLENDAVRVEIGPQGRVTGVTDKRSGRQVVPDGAWANELVVYTDRGDAWDFPMDYAAAEPRRPERTSVSSRTEGPQAIVEQVFTVGQSEIRQQIVLTAASARIDFRTQATWRETESMLRVRFPVTVQATTAAFDIQFGHIHRGTDCNTTWDLARDEVAVHKWADLSTPDAGVALLNDCKYGMRVKDGVLDLNLIRSVPHPGPRISPDVDTAAAEPHGDFTDQCEHEMVYSLLPHGGNGTDGHVARAGYELNVPLLTAPGAGGSGMPARSWLQVDAAGIVVEAVKAAEDGSGDWIVRLYESRGAATQATVRCDLPLTAAHVADLMEQPLDALETADLRVHFHPFEIHTLRLRPA